MICEKAICPYCGKEVYIENDASPFNGDLYTEECSNCGKIFSYTVRVVTEIDTYKCECQLEGHKWELSNTFPKCFSTMYCPECGERRSLTEEEKKKYNIPSREEYFRTLNSSNNEMS